MIDPWETNKDQMKKNNNKRVYHQSCPLSCEVEKCQKEL